MTDLLPCPFCGGPAHDQKDAAGIMCLNDGCLVRPHATSMTKAGAIKIWNSRAHLPGLPQTPPLPVEAIRAAVTLIARKLTKLSWSRDECRRKGQDVYVANLTAQMDTLDGYHRDLSALVSRPHGN